MSQIRFYCRVKTFFLIHVNGIDYGKIFNISKSGMLLSTNLPLAISDNVALEIYLSKNRHLKASGKVVRKAEEKKYGIQFVDLPDQEKTILNKYILGCCRDAVLNSGA